MVNMPQIFQLASGRGQQTNVPSYGAGTCIDTTENIVRSFQSHNIRSEANSTSFHSSPDSPNPPSGQSKEDCRSCHSGCLHIGSRGNGGTSYQLDNSSLYVPIFCLCFLLT